MATITTLTQTSSATTFSTRQWKNVPVVWSNVIDFAEAATAKGSTLANTDVIEALRIPAGSIVMQAGIKVLVAVTGASNDNTICLGITGVDADQWVDDYDLDAAAAGAIATPVGPGTTDPMAYTATSDTLDITWSAGTTLPTAGKILVSALVVNLFDTEEAGLAQIGD